MKKIFTLSAMIIFCMLTTSLQAQGIYQMWGTTGFGGKDSRGSFFSTKYDGTGLQNKTFFTSANSGRPYTGNVPVAYNGKLYSILKYGGVNDGGVISEYDPVSNVYTTRANFFDLNMASGWGAMVVAGTKLYGITSEYGSGKPSEIFEFNPANGVTIGRHTFTTATGDDVAHEPAMYNNKLYGITESGGNNNRGVIYEFDPANGVYSVKHHFAAPMNGNYRAGFVMYSGKLYSVDDNGFIFSFDPATNIVSATQSISAINGSVFVGHMAVLNNKLYGVAGEGGPGNDGFIFEYNPATNGLLMKKDFTATTAYRYVSLISHNGMLYGSSHVGGVYNEGELFSYEPVGNVYTSMQAYNIANGGSGQEKLMVFNNKLYGWLAYTDFSSRKGRLFEYNLSNSQFAITARLGENELELPQGELMYYKHKLYGVATDGGALSAGGIYAFDLQTQTFETKVNLAETVGRFFNQGGFLLHNEKFYGVTHRGGANGYGTLFSYDPATNAYEQLFSFGGLNGQHPYGQLVLFNGKMYGTCSSSSIADRGTIFEYNPVTNVLQTKFIFDGIRGTYPKAGLTVFDGRIFGLAYGGGVHQSGTLFEYLPPLNDVVKLADFNVNVTGAYPVGKMLAYNNKLWGVTGTSELGNYEGTIFEYDIASGILSEKIQLDDDIGGLNPMAGMTLLNNKMYGMTNLGGSSTTGLLYEYDPAINSYTVKTHFQPLTGKWPRNTQLAKAPAPTGPGSANSCTNTQTININAANANQWIPFTDAQGRAVAEINANGNILGNTAVRVFVNGGNTRLHANGLFYLDRNITITAANQPATPVSIRLYIKKTEFETLKATAGSGVNVPDDLTLFRNNDFCTPVISSTLTQLVSVKSDWGFDYVYSADVNNLSSFYFASKNNVVLPVKMIYFKGAVQATANQLEWKSVCTNAVDFIIERSTDGIHFDSIGIIKAQQIDCNAPFTFMDETPAAISYYRIKMLEDNGTISYSSIVLLERKGSQLLQIVLMPNPVIGNVARLQITAAKAQQLSIKLHDATGRNITSSSIKLLKGVQQFNLPLPALAAGVYYLQCGEGNEKLMIKMLKQ